MRTNARRTPIPDSTLALAAALRRQAAAAGLNAPAIAERSKIDRQNVHLILTGKMDPRVSTVAAILAAMGASWADLDGNPENLS